ncbi:MAG: glycosyltransferase [Phycisphaera sp.]|nr:glycosyltransferase [Phycisphaera sp.]
MRILHVITRLILGGAQQNTVDSCAAQVKPGHDVTLVHGPVYGPEGSLLVEAHATGAKVIEINAMRRALLPWHDIACFYALCRVIRDFQPDIVHTHSSKAGIIGRFAAWSERRDNMPRIIHTVHGLPFHDRQPRVVHDLYVGLERAAARRCDVLVGVSDSMRKAFDQANITQGKRFVTIPSGVDTTMFQPVDVAQRKTIRLELGVGLHTPLVGLVARLDPLKGQDDVLDILPRLIEKHPQLHVLFAGSGWQESALKDRVHKMHMTDRVIFTGLVTPHRVSELIGALDVNLLPSYQEGQPRTLIQALLCGVPIVGYDAGGITDICINGQTGRCVPTGDRDALLDAVLWTLAHPDEARAMAEQGGQIARERYSVTAMTTQLEKLYRETLDTPAA